jgi:hypothetical protein
MAPTRDADNIAAPVASMTTKTISARRRRDISRATSLLG